ncbi:MAG: decarboxylase [Candidatus Cloacimonadota bacterium]|nr:MAG: decarboxylase [Candidatus Cloacimonadota bacterium]
MIKAICGLLILMLCSSLFAGNNFEVKYKGALKNIMHKGDISAKYSLSEIAGKENIYALGALENLQGEIQIFDSKPFNSAGINEKIEISNSYSKKASLLVYAQVSEWTEINIPNEILSYEQLETYIAEKAEENRLDVDKPFPFLLEGKPESIDWHIIKWEIGDNDHSHQKHIESGPHGTLEKTEMDILGFYSSRHHAIFTHHTTNMHLHFKTADEKIAGHLDGMKLGQNMVLKLPKPNKK